MFGERENNRARDTTMALVIKKMVDYYFYLNDEISGEHEFIFSRKKNTKKIHIITHIDHMRR